jgi:hypothetical protein
MMKYSRTYYRDSPYYSGNHLVVLLLLVCRVNPIASFHILGHLQLPAMASLPFSRITITNGIAIPNVASTTTSRLRLAKDASEDGNSSSSSTGRRIRFSGADLSSLLESGDNDVAGNPFDTVLSFLSSDVVSIVLGLLGLCVVVFHRLVLLDSASADALTLQTRTDLLAVFACGSVLLNGVTKLDVTTALAESVILNGEKLSTPECMTRDDKQLQTITSSSDGSTLSWVLESLLVATPTKSAVILTKDKKRSTNNDGSNGWLIQWRAGIVPSTSTNPYAILVPEKSPILDRVGTPGNAKETYLPTLQALPGRFEFTYLPSNTQMALLIPITTTRSQQSTEKGNDHDDDGIVGSGEEGVINYNSVLVLGSDTAKSFTPRDIAWSRIVSERLGQHLI